MSGSPEILVRRVCTDSREARPHDLFVALRGERFDGHAFLDEVIAQGVAGAVVERTKLPARLAESGIIAVENSRAAFGRMAARYRADFVLSIVGVGGSNGKTTTKELLASVLGQKFKALVSKASFNNDIGVPTTLLDLTHEHEIAVLEFGTNHPGELHGLLELARPRFGVITSIGREHLEFFGDLDGVIREEGSLAELLPADGKLFLNGDSPGADQIRRRSTAPVVLVGFNARNHWRAQDIRMDRTGTSFHVEAAQPGFAGEYRLPLLGRHQATNAMFAIALGAELGLTRQEVQAGLVECAPAKMRLQYSDLGEVHLLDDSYNANADSMCAALDTLRDFPSKGRRVAVLGDMAELGAHTEAAHKEIGRYVAASDVSRLFAVGKLAPLMAAAARQSGLEAVEEFTDLNGAAEAVGRFVRRNDVILLKASRASGLEKVGEILRQRLAAVRESDLSQRREPGNNG